MENASKALIIAASVLVAIMIVAMGVRIFNCAQSSADSTSLDTTEIAMFNGKFERYAQEQLGSQVKSLISFCISNASTNKDDDYRLPNVKLVNKDETEAAADNTATKSNVTILGNIRKAIITTHPYYVDISYNNNTGLVNDITIYYTKP